MATPVLNTHHIHDAAFKLAMQDLRVARSFLQQYLDRAVLALIDIAAVELAPTELTTPILKTLRADVC